eukprot:CAMPEP_0197826136 /NCGR_PEP_ID=MMETSP1437-20131217/3125_1 /TAXON_ID=49252 ORGANISM="Eucampia antarctica, Strain CCMP1452" /NCGR_SAMPLE_ID=MMETSP1437 /ASSEMBLY_ACC=CAM_ASM_001096 /LENGTH=556 /DNA_ID=CAMNT_0043426431 /DNA_START=59 /DNA_END=1729 /DNA_ORIENTATION=+
MGNSHTGTKGDLSIHLNPPSGVNTNGAYLAGSKITGTVYASVPANDDGNYADAGDVYIQLKGKEKVKVRYHETEFDEIEEEEQRVEKFEKKSRNIVKLKIALGSDDKDSIQEGKYAYPFEIQVPEQLPTSMKIKDDEEYCRIEYKIETVANKKVVKNDKKKIKILAKPPSSEPLSNFVEPVTEKISTCCCGQGEITFGAKVDDTRIGAGEKMNVDFACKNEATVEIESVEATIHEYVEWIAGEHKYHRNNEITKGTFQKDESMDQITKTAMKTNRENEDNDLERGLKDELLKEIWHSIQDGSNNVTLDIPLLAHHTYSGAHIHVVHTLTVQILTSGLLSDSPSITIPLAIVTPNHVSDNDSIEPKYDYDPPEDWDMNNITTAPAAHNYESAPIFGGAYVSGNTEEDIHVAPIQFTDNSADPEQASLPALLQKIDFSINAKSTIQELINDVSWNRQLFSTLQPQDLADIVKRVTMEFDQTDVAAMIAQVISNFTTYHVVSLLRTLATWTRIQLVQRLLPYCKDISTNSSVILADLTDWEKVCTESDFKIAIDSRMAL